MKILILCVGLQQRVKCFPLHLTKRTQVEWWAYVSISHLNVIFNEACCLHTSLHIETDVHLHLRFLVSQLDDWHLKREKYYSAQWKRKHFHGRNSEIEQKIKNEL